MTDDEALLALAEAAGVQVQWNDAVGAPQVVALENVRRILTALGHDCATASDCAEAMRRLRSDETPSFVTADAGAPVEVPGLAGRARLVLEDGSARDVDVAGLTIDAPGYHRLEHDGGVVTLAVAPARAWPLPVARGGGRAWGASVQIYALRTRRALGDFGAVADFAAEAAARGADALAISPVHALFSADPERCSPYSPSSREWLNPLLIDPGVAGVADSIGPQAPPLIDWAGAARARLGALELGFRRGYSNAEWLRAGAFRAWAEHQGEALRRHAVFEALHGHFFRETGARGWQDWPVEYRDPASPAVAEFAANHVREIDFQMFLQWAADLSLGRAQGAAKDAGMTIGLVADLAVGLDPGGSHAWSAREELLSGLSIGAPPDLFQAAGQNWALTGFAPDALRRSGFAPFLRMLRTAMRHAGAIRIDHALGLRRLWLVPEGGSPTEGAYVTMPEADLMRLVALESHRARVAVIGEDLGVIPPGFREGMIARGLYGMRVLPFERHWDNGFRPPRWWDAQAVALTSTHDLPPVAGWWQGRDLDWREKLTGETMDEARAERAEDRTRLWREAVNEGLAEGPEPALDDPAPAVDAACAFVAATSCALALFPAEDLFGLDEAPNLPGTVDEHPNWRRRMPDNAKNLFRGAEARVKRIDSVRKGE
ncbi:4-alpha-glucanotransferase [Sphingomonas parva]|uniref:4-alpha-glucanotransferase n=1 Tax=Sphingomonas parva TaxID=2555898 RepID=A0A4Y8ZS47_9SPHN|nr:4-alpha-glucanotransferase [Sphingomonas parva]TFI58744.1 4-alpha-glucanotransferase [Sphingomonas parva]